MARFQRWKSLMWRRNKFKLFMYQFRVFNYLRFMQTILMKSRVLVLSLYSHNILCGNKTMRSFENGNYSLMKNIIAWWNSAQSFPFVYLFPSYFEPKIRWLIQWKWFFFSFQRIVIFFFAINMRLSLLKLSGVDKFSYRIREKQIPICHFSLHFLFRLNSSFRIPIR